ncbi:hypothetical protein C9374_000065 [Naegleria lovaniensis]|uniref:Uncharacterized protein n=1 Tax=Naegleria lovaniensis TaxID=51637 RepID=A0AA88GZ30_NAELO|nr:uncharacterized protein C9374_000065 [Naegleria lovaniensis]KAG2388626.1 hypothetical protein C9374_000065 [Naegleria lovaniensis]
MNSSSLWCWFSPTTTSILLDAAILSMVCLTGWFLYGSLCIYWNYRKVKHIPGSFQYFFSFIPIPFFAEHIYFGGEDTVEKLIQERGEAKTGLVRVSMASKNGHSQ